MSNDDVLSQDEISADEISKRAIQSARVTFRKLKSSFVALAGNKGAVGRPGPPGKPGRPGRPRPPGRPGFRRPTGKEADNHEISPLLQEYLRHIFVGIHLPTGTNVFTDYPTSFIAGMGWAIPRVHS